MGSAYQFHSWRVFVLVCAFPSVAAIASLTTMPESPRFFLEVSRDHFLKNPFRSSLPNSNSNLNHLKPYTVEVGSLHTP
jgi:hypothetical protein